jgi:hypothetical protein
MAATSIGTGVEQPNEINGEYYYTPDVTTNNSN